MTIFRDYSSKPLGVRKWGSGEVGKWGGGEMGKWGNGEVGKWGISAKTLKP
ncbi:MULTISPECIES: hypothetical protein [Microcystis]|uniref:Ribosomal-protein-S18p-alanine acetyltransferase n=1 Tax=Microcystis panniformis FACHB-1757 TaxID=1638788 RepID=A0A0K1S6N3_9CHRO|nr:MULTISPECIES: hypothetical protein [Microcystis]AKV69631.1 Ribosomal-protein-S18p-alanine acetyltransferase [Microcystis panniformis FACHB-1757]